MYAMFGHGSQPWQKAVVELSEWLHIRQMLIENHGAMPDMAHSEKSCHLKGA